MAQYKIGRRFYMLGRVYEPGELVTVSDTFRPAKDWELVGLEEPKVEGTSVPDPKPSAPPLGVKITKRPSDREPV